jgi:ketosteroid isomerase-like protein
MQPREPETSAPAGASETEVLRALYAALNRGDVAAVVRALDPRVEWTDPVEDPADGTYRGLAAVEAHIARARAGWAEGSCEPERFLAAGDRIVVFVRVRVRLAGESHWREGRLGDVYTFRGGRVVRARSFADRRQALASVGLDASLAD